MGRLSGLYPEKVFEYFELLSSVPHGSGNTGAIADLCVDFALKHGYEYTRDELNNVIIFAPGTKGYENKQPVIIQGHLDMVCAKEPGSTIDMAVTPVDIYTDGDYVKAKGTSLGGDDVIAPAIAMAIMDSDRPHPPIEAVFTVDEEVGMDGAVAIDVSRLKGRMMINIDSEEEDVITAGCAGGARAYCTIPVLRTRIDNTYYKGYELKISGLKGGHSGCDIDKGRANANVLMSRMLYYVSSKILILIDKFEGGKFDNVITQECEARVFVPNGKLQQFEAMILESQSVYGNEFGTADPDVKVSMTPFEFKTAEPVCVKGSVNIAASMFAIPFGIQEMSMDIKGLVQTSLNPGISFLGHDAFDFSYCVRSSVATQKKMLLDKIRMILGYLGGSLDVAGEYPGWQFSKESRLRDLFADVIKEQTGKECIITATHGGLECGMFIDKIPGLDCISVGPELHEVHSVRERLGISSCGRLFDRICTVLERM